MDSSSVWGGYLSAPGRGVVLVALAREVKQLLNHCSVLATGQALQQGFDGFPVGLFQSHPRGQPPATHRHTGGRVKQFTRRHGLRRKRWVTLTLNIILNA